MAKNLTEIASNLAKRYPEMTNKKALSVTRYVLANIIKGVVDLEPDSRDRVVLGQLALIGLKRTQERTVRNITTGEKVTIPAGIRVIFKATDFLKKAALTKDYELPVDDEPESAPAEKPAKKDAGDSSEPAKPAAKKAPAAKAKKEEDDINPDDIPDISDL